MPSPLQKVKPTLGVDYLQESVHERFVEFISVCLLVGNAHISVLENKACI